MFYSRRQPLKKRVLRQYVFIYWTTTDDIIWRPGDRVPVRIVESPVTATFDAASYEKTEGDTFDVTVTLGASFLNGTFTLPVSVTPNGGATEADYSGIPENLVFPPGVTEQTFTVTVEDDTEDDDEESITLSFGDENHIRPGGDNETTTITLADNDDPSVTVMFDQDAHTVPEGGMQTIEVTLSADPERELIIPLTDTPRGGATGDDYSVPASVTFNAGEMETSFTFAADQDTEDDDEDNVRLGFGTMPDARVSAGTPDETTVNIADDDDPFVTVMYGQSSYTVAEGGMQTIAVTLSANPERTVEIPLEVTHQGGATSADYSGVPPSVTFGSGETSKSFTFAADDDTEDDDEDSVLLGFGTMPDPRVSAGTPDQATVSIADDDDPFVTVMYGQTDYIVVEGETILVRVALSADPERTVVIPLTATEQDGASSIDYSALPSSVTLSAGDTSRTFEFTASADSFADTGESVKLGFGTMPDARVSAGSPEEATVHIRQFSTEFTLDCMTSVWCADLQFSDQSKLDWGWALLEHGKRKDPASTLSDDSFTFRGVEYVVQAIRLRAGTYPTLANAWSREEQNESYLEIFIRRAEWSVGPSREHYQDWVLHMDGLQLPFKDTVDHQGGFLWIDADLQQFYNDWMSTKVTQIGIEERQDLPPSLAVPWLPRAVDAHGYYRNGRPELAVSWNSPHWHYPLPEPTGYIVQWKLASDSWDAPGAVDQMAVRGDHGRGVRIQGLRGNALLGSALYSARVFPFNDVGDGPVSEDTLGRTQGGSPRLMATTVNGPNLTLRYDRDLDANSIPAAASFVVLVDAGLRAVTRVEVNGREIILTLVTPVHADNHVQAVYEEPNDPTATFLRDTDGQHVDLSSRSDRLQNVVNETPQTDLPPLTAEFANFPSSPRWQRPLHLQRRVQRVGLDLAGPAPGRHAGGGGRHGHIGPSG